ncbi:MAG TPA: hypothetical protein VLJ59_03505 [Mycobacteriales bacterium]|nr:hypothetical protein [Mycobacteriales bacterium]
MWDPAGGEYLRRPVPAAVTVTAADLLQAAANPKRGTVLTVEELDTEAPLQGRWLDDLALWASHREDRRPLPSCVVKLTAPELTGDQLVGATEMAEIAGVAASTLRAYLSRGEGDLPQPQATVNGRSVWARPVAEEWAEQRHSSPESVKEAVSARRAGASSVPVGVAEVWTWFAQSFFSHLWHNPERRKRWALRWRTEAAARDLAETLGWGVAANLTKIIPIEDLASTIEHAVLDELVIGQKLTRDLNDDSDVGLYGITPPVAGMLDWLIRHSPNHASHTIAEIVGEAERRLGVPRTVSADSIRTALSLDGKLDTNTRNKFLDRVLGSALSGQN